MWDLSSLTRDWTHIHCTERRFLTTGLKGKSQMEILEIKYMKKTCLELRTALWCLKIAIEFNNISIDAFELWCWRRLESPVDCKEIQPVHSKEDQAWVFFERNDAIAETPVLWPPHAKSWLIGKDSDAGRDWGQKEKGMTEDEMAAWHHQFDGHEFELTLGVGDGQGGLACCSSWGRKESDTMSDWTELNLTERLIEILAVDV